LRGAFRSLRNYNYRVWAAGALVSNVGTWMQRTAQDWLVLAELTHKSATALGIVMALQFGPHALMLPLSGFAADTFDRRKLLMTTQATMGLLALGLGILTLSGAARLWHVYLFAFLLGCVSAFDSAARQTFVAELVGEEDLSNAVGLNSTSFNAARMIGPAVAGMLIAGVGTGWVFVINSASFVAVLCSLYGLRVDELHRSPKRAGGRGGLIDGFRYVRGRPDIQAILLMLFLIGTFGVNFPIFISTMAVGVFHAGAGQFGLLTSMMAIGSVAGALLSARRERPGMGVIVAAAAIFGLGFCIAAAMPSYGLFGGALVIIGLSAQTFSTTANSVIQLSTDPDMRGRVIALFLAIALGATPIGAPFVGWVADTFGPRWALGVGAASGFGAVIVAIHYFARHRGLRLSINDGRLDVSMAEVAGGRRRLE
jgi:MFS family permease